MGERIEIPLSKIKMFRLIVGFSLFVVAGFLLIFNALDFQNITIPFMRNPLVIRSIGIAAILFFGFTLIIGIRRNFDKRAGLIIDNDGITDHTNASSIGLIEWADIEGIREKRVMSTKFLLIDVSNPEKYIAKAKSKVKAKLLRTNLRSNDTPLSISTNAFKCDFKELENLIRTEFEKKDRINRQ